MLLFLITNISGCTLASSQQLDVSIEIVDSSYMNVKISNIKIDSDSIILQFPKSITGTYHKILNHVYDFKAYNSNGTKIKTITKGSDYLIKNSKELNTINYKVKFTDYNSINILSSGNIYEKDLLVINNNTLFCKFPNNNIQYDVRIKKRQEFINISNLNVIVENDSTDLIKFSDYYQLINSPIIYSSNSKTDSIIINEKKIIINVHNTQYKIDANYLSNVLKTTIESTINEINFTFEDSYILTFLYNDRVKNNIYKEIALEHNSSSIYHFFSEPYFFNIKDSIKFTTDLQHMVSHELFHVFTPINFSDNLVNNFFSDSLRMSSHLWMYEGFVEYQSLKILLNNGIIDFKTFISKIEEKINNYNKFEKMKYYTSLAKVSENIYNKHLLGTFYNRAAVLCFLMDIEVVELSGGKYDLMSVLKEIFDSSPSFHKNSLFIEMNRIVPGIDSFINSYIVDDNFPNISSYLSKAGIKYSKVIKEYGYFFPIKILDDTSNNKSVFITFSEDVYPFKKDETIELTEINGIPVTSFSLSFLYRRYFDFQNTFNIKYLNNGQLLSTTIKPIVARVPKVPYYPNISVNKSMTSNQRAVYNKLFEQK